MVLNYVNAFGIVKQLAVGRGEQKSIVAFENTHRKKPGEKN